MVVLISNKYYQYYYVITYYVPLIFMVVHITEVFPTMHMVVHNPVDEFLVLHITLPSIIW
jgi:hypothetical protein